MANEKVVPIFPTANLKATLEFYTMLGFKVLYEQHAPSVYGSVALENIQIDFVGNNALTPNQENGHMCLVAVNNIDELNKAFSNRIKATFGKQLRSGLPRMNDVSDVKSGDRRFNMVDPSGSYLIFVQVAEKPAKSAKAKSTSPLTPLARAVKSARLFAYSRDDPKMAVEHLDPALEKRDSESVVTQFQAFILRADIAVMLDDKVTLEKYLNAAKSLDLEEADLLEVQEELERLAQLEG
jgi:catechol 2,3-dioxygenase-like lactoylglutathione lyase family enzyme